MGSGSVYPLVPNSERRDPISAPDLFDVVLRASWLVSEILMNVLGIVYWSALVLLSIKAIASAT
jgi:hypothetical protein